MSRASSVWLHRFATFVSGCTVLLLLAGSLVTSTGSGLSVPDWPTSYGWSMFTFPPSKWVGGIFYEHTHRLIATSVGFFTIALAGWVWFGESRRWMRWLGLAALGAVIAQGLLGGLTVLFFLPTAISTAHAALAEIFFCMTAAIALFTSDGWLQGYTGRVGQVGQVGQEGRLGRVGEVGGVDWVRVFATTTTGLIYAQILVGAAMRHAGAGLAIPDFPLMFGHLIPPRWSGGIAIHFAHRVGAAVVALAILATSRRIALSERHRPEMVRPAVLMVGLVALQLTLGALTVLTRREASINSAHVVCGALVLATSLVLTLRTWRTSFAPQSEVVATFEAAPPAPSAGVMEPAHVGLRPGARAGARS